MNSPSNSVSEFPIRSIGATDPVGDPSDVLVGTARAVGEPLVLHRAMRPNTSSPFPRPAHAAGAVNVVVTTTGGTGTLTNGYTYAVVTLTAPTGVNARAVSTSQIDITWNAVSGATSYQVDRKSPGGAFTQIGTPGSTSFSDAGRAAGTSFLYLIRAVNAGGASPNSAADLATTVIFTDNPLVAGTIVKALHISELRTGVNAVRTLAGQGAFTFTGTAGAGTIISAVHLNDLRTAVDAARGVLGLSTGGYTDPSLAGVTVKALHFQELRNKVE